MKSCTRVILSVLLAAAVGLVATAAYAYSLKWSQPPVPGGNFQTECFYGWDEASAYQQGPAIVADDWVCQGGQPVSDIHWWGSYKGWTGSQPPPAAPDAFHIAIWTDAPAGQQDFSHPGRLIREWRVEREKANETLAGCDYEPSYANPPEACFKYDLQLPQAEWFYQPGSNTTYWLSIAAVYSGLIETPYPWGWTTRPRYSVPFGNDAAIKISDPLTPTVGSEYVAGEQVMDVTGAAWDMAFELTSPDYDFGDAPERSVAAGYPTRLSSDGARHLISPGLYLGASVDAEADGQPTDQADGDDLNPPRGIDDEDGVVLPLLMPGQPAVLEVTASAPGYLNAWIDFNADTDWSDAGEQVFSGTLLVTGVNTLNVPVPSGAAGATFARFRFSSAASLSPAGEAPDGEVEDYRLEFVTWGKWVNGELWSPNLVVTAETSDTITIVDVITYPQPFQLTENWRPGRLVPLTYTLDPPDGGTVTVYLENSTMVWDVPFTPTQVMTLTKQFRVEPCTWDETTLRETLGPAPQPGIPGTQEIRDVIIVKRQPELGIDSVYAPDVYAGLPAAFTLVYSNAGGYENNVVITNTFPRLAPFESSDPLPTAQDPNGLWANWSVGNLPGGEGSSIDVTVTVASGLQPSTTIEIWDGIFNHAGELMDEVTSTFHVRSPWDKLVNGEPLNDGAAYTVQTSDTITIADVFQPASSFTLTERWTPGELDLITYTIEPAPIGTVTIKIGADEAVLVWGVPVIPTQVVTLTKLFRVEPCTWRSTTLYESLGGPVGAAPDTRDVTFFKEQPILGIDSLYSPPVRPGQLAAFTLVYSNSGGLENAVWITNTFPAAAPFVESQPKPDSQDDAGAWAAWYFDSMPKGAQGSIQVTVAITTGLLPSPAIHIWDGIHNHLGQVMDEVTTTFYLSPWAKWINGQLWKPDLVVTAQTSDTIMIVDSFDPSAGTVYLVETWEADKLALLDWKLEGENAGVVISDAGYLRWEASPQEVVTLTKFFHVEPCTWTQTIINETSGPPTGQGELRSVTIAKLAPDLHIAAEYAPEVYAGQQTVFTLTYSNMGGYENGVVITQTFSPRQALFVSSVPEPDALNQDGGWARWKLGDLATNDWGSIVVTVSIDAGLRTSTTVRIWDGIYNHAGELADEVDIPLHVKNIYTSASSGNWHDPSTWGVAGVPTTTSDVTITAGTRVTVAGPASCNRLFIAPGAGLIISNPFSLTVEDELFNHGWLRMGRINSSPVPTITRGAAAVLQQPTTFAIQNADGSQVKYHGLVITPTAGSMGLITVTIKGNQACDGVSGTVLRCYDITPETPLPATVAFYYRSDEAGGNASPIAWHWNAGEGRWDGLSSTRGGGGDAMWVQATGVTQYSPFTLDDGIPTAVTLKSLATAQMALLVVLLAGLIVLGLAGLVASWGRRTWRAR
ncbi:MAG: hypothetical protein JW850_03180 [Thermoflexales bacterium]|nr:hypothetical protein [Thermoflexales bacterium]